MTQPLPYERDYSFTGFQSGHPKTPLPGDKVDAELDAIASVMDEVLERIALIQRDDLALANKSVGYDQFKDEVSLGFEPPTVWVTAHVYAARDTVFHDTGFYRCLIAHTSGTFATDLSALDWELLADFLPPIAGKMDTITYDPTGIAADVFARTNHTGTQLASTISNFSAAADARIAAAVGVSVQAYDADLTAWAAVNPSAYLNTAAIAAAYQPLDADLTSWAALTRAANFDGLVTGGTSAALRTFLTDELGTGSAVFESVIPLDMPNGRLTLTTAVPVTTADVAGATSIFYTPAAGDRVPIYNGTRWTSTVFTELTLALDSNAAHTGYQQSAKIFDLFVISDAGTIRLANGPAWTSDTARGTGAGTTELELKNGIYTNKNSLATARFGSAAGNTVAVSANQGTYVGSFRATADGQASDTVLLRLLYNTYNQAPRLMRRADPAVSWAYSTATIRQSNANAANQVGFLFGLAGAMAEAKVTTPVSEAGATVRNVVAGIGLDSTVAFSSTNSDLGQVSSASFSNLSASYVGNPGLGYHVLTQLEYGAGAGTQTWYGTVGPWVGGLTGTVYA
ncbi:hypothetical protein [Mesorhizobium sp. M0139]|uniref:hypothetical protein n=1 Tax=Mesorhizobium sp. M0139 TaxID=2956892 RepID=UPI0033388F6E